jgi:cell growth-regulating nucleolar protein
VLQTVKKNQVDKHAQRCRSCHAVTCVDCSVTFYGDDYAQHVTCVSEAEKYEKTLYKPKAGKANPQDIWNTIIETATSQAASAPAIVRPYLSRLGELNNVPRNKKKFINFAKNSLKLYSDAVLEALWTYLDTFRLEQKQDAEEAKKAVSTSKTIQDEVTTKEKISSESVEEVDLAKEEKKKLKKEKRKREAEEAEAAAATTVEETSEKEKKHKKKKKDKHQD